MIHSWTVVHWMIIGVYAFYITHLSKKLDGPRKYFYMTVLSLTLWASFDFLMVNMVDHELAVIVTYVSSGLVSSAAGLIYIMVLSFEKEVLSAREKIISLIPFIVMISQIPWFGGVIETEFGLHAHYSANQMIWMAATALVVAYSLYKFNKIKMRVQKKDTVKKVNILSLSVLIATTGGVVGAVLSSLYPHIIPSSATMVFLMIGLLPSWLAFRK